MLLRVDSLAATHAVAARIASMARVGDIIVLAGEMGAGKTAFAQGFGAALGVTDPITSPTFTLVHSYPIGDRRTLHHADLYRLDSMADVEELALHELAEFDGIVLVEWGDVAASGLGGHLEVRLEHDDEDTDEHDDEDTVDDTTDDTAEDTAGDVDVDDGAEIALSERRLIDINPSGNRWASRWNQLDSLLAAYRC
ncbi:MAG TPA: tRNA (adenosine(37)-N6)-threonylcarbamoyltransferase complex ATPase subunit type 1 TsaE [Ilumatobacter sp.]|nr:tRNA (adenosine(37)-N6)-threonylcarbamoyltransferase complex ATPase subunit type 1 TsaE [Ilumatobacter sp.]